MDKYQELVWPAFLKYCSSNEIIFNVDNSTKNIVKVIDGAVLLQKGYDKGNEVWVTITKDFVKLLYDATVRHRKRITLGELEVLFPGIRDLGFVFKVFSALDNLFRYEFREKRVYLK